MLVGALSTFVTLRLFTAGDEVKVPELIGQEPTKAIQVLAREGLQLKILPQKRYSNTVVADRIVAQQPVAQTKIKRGRSVEVYISLGPERVVVPDLLGQTRRVAMMMLNQKGLQEGKVISVYSNDAEEDQILAQYPVSGTEMIGNRTVDILVNSSRDGGLVFVMPDVIGKPISEVSDYFKQAGLRISSSMPIDYP